MFGRLLCWAFGHRRGKRVFIAPSEYGSPPPEGYALMRCPRCGAQWTRKVKAKAGA